MVPLFGSGLKTLSLQTFPPRTPPSPPERIKFDLNGDKLMPVPGSAEFWLARNLWNPASAMTFKSPRKAARPLWQPMKSSEHF